MEQFIILGLFTYGAKCMIDRMNRKQPLLASKNDITPILNQKDLMKFDEVEAPQQFILDAKRNTVTYINGYRHSILQCIKILYKEFGYTGGIRIMNLCSQAAMAKPIEMAIQHFQCPVHGCGNMTCHVYHSHIVMITVKSIASVYRVKDDEKVIEGYIILKHQTKLSDLYSLNEIDSEDSISQLMTLRQARELFYDF